MKWNVPLSFFAFSHLTSHDEILRLNLFIFSFISIFNVAVLRLKIQFSVLLICFCIFNHIFWLSNRCAKLKTWFSRLVWMSMTKIFMQIYFSSFRFRKHDKILYINKNLYHFKIFFSFLNFSIMQILRR